MLACLLNPECRKVSVYVMAVLLVECLFYSLSVESFFNLHICGDKPSAMFAIFGVDSGDGAFFAGENPMLE